MKKIDTLLFPRWIVPIEPHNVFLENHALAIHEGRILETLPNEQAKKSYQAINIVELKTHVVMPGLINSHTHSPMTLFRGMADDLALMDWLQNHIWPAEAKWLSDDFCYDGTQLAILEMLRSGTTCFNDNFFYSESIGRAAADAGIRVYLGTCIIDFPTSYAKNINEYLSKAASTYQSWKNHPLISVSIAPHAPYTVSDETFLKVRNFVEKHNVRIHLHLQETADEVQQSLQLYNKRPIQRMYDLGIMSKLLECVHMTQIVPEDIALLQKTGAHVVHCPESNLKLVSGFTPIEQLMDAGINVALGTDGAASNNDLDMFGELHIAALLAKTVAQKPRALTAAETLRMATLGGARALGLENIVGSLASGKAADIIAIDLTAINTQPVYNPISHLVYAVNSRQVTDVWVNGKQLLKNGTFLSLNENDIIEKAMEWKEKIQESQKLVSTSK